MLHIEATSKRPWRASLDHQKAVQTATYCEVQYWGAIGHFEHHLPEQ